jgi:hypothetical protein
MRRVVQRQKQWPFAIAVARQNFETKKSQPSAMPLAGFLLRGF